MRWKRWRPRPGQYVNTSRVRLRKVNARFARGTEPDMLVLDAGAGRGPYRKLFKHARYEAADFAQLGTKYTPLDYVCSLTNIPVEDSRFDRVLFNQVLEHVNDPPAVLAELHRVLKPGGQILCSCPLYFHEHQKPYDFFRYTKYGLRHLFELAGFEVTRISWLEGYFGTIAHQFRQMHLHLPRNARALEPGWRIVYLAPLLWSTRLLATGLMIAYSHAELRWKYTAAGMPKNYVVLASKPEHESAGSGVVH
jgi:SAM-dependent methyltransferase